MSLICQEADQPTEEGLAAYQEELQRTMDSQLEEGPLKNHYYREFVTRVRIVWRNHRVTIFEKDQDGRLRVRR